MLTELVEKEGTIQETESHMIQSVFEFDDKLVKEILTPRVDIIGIDSMASLDEAMEGSSLVTTDVWVSMGDEDEKEKREQLFRDYQINPSVMDKANKKAIFLHCLPAIRGQEISEDLLEDKRSKVWNQAENRLHAQKALLVKLLK